MVKRKKLKRRERYSPQLTKLEEEEIAKILLSIKIKETNIMKVKKFEKINENENYIDNYLPSSPPPILKKVDLKVPLLKKNSVTSSKWCIIS